MTKIKPGNYFPLRKLFTANLRPDDQRVVKSAETTTYLTTLPLETDAVAIRVGLVNTTDLPFPIDGICVCESTDWNAAKSTRWLYFSFSDEAAEMKGTAAAPCPVIVPRTKVHPITGARDVPVIVWSDWMDFETKAGGSRPQLQFRSLISTEVAILGAPTRPALPAADQPVRVRAYGAVAGDYVTSPNQPLPDVAPSPYSPISIIQYRSLKPGLQFVIGGDSHLARSSMFAQLAADQLSTPDAPISVWNTAREAKNSNTFWPALDQAIDLANPSLALIQGWTANDGMTPERDQAYLLRVTESAERTLYASGVPVIVKGMPRQLFGKAALASWQVVNMKLDKMLPDALVFDPLAAIGKPGVPGNWRDNLSNDGVHPNITANLAMRDLFRAFIRDGLDPSLWPQQAATPG